jgi:cysteine desulfurase
MIYLDHAATTPLDARVLEVMLPFLTTRYGNASSVHSEGRRARVAVESARDSIAEQIGAEASEIVFTSSGTEADALAINGVLRDGGALLTSAAEHEAVLRPAEQLQSERRAVIVRPNGTGAVEAPTVEEILASRADIRLVSLMSANNEVGTITPLADIAQTCRRRSIPLHTDAVQSVGLLDINVDSLGVDMLTASAHKFYGPKGAGFLYVRGGLDLEPIVRGSQERGRRGGTENVAAIVGMARALELARLERDERIAHAMELRNNLLDALKNLADPGMVLITPEDSRLAVPQVVNVAFRPHEGQVIDGEMLILNMDMEGIAVSAGSACTSGALEPSHVLLAAGFDRATASATVRFSTGKDTTLDEIERAVETLARVVERMRRLALV